MPPASRKPWRLKGPYPYSAWRHSDGCEGHKVTGRNSPRFGARFYESPRATGACGPEEALLTRREREVMKLVVSGLLNKQIAADLGTSNSSRSTGSLAELVRMAEKLQRPYGCCPADLHAVVQLCYPVFHVAPLTVNMLAWRVGARSRRISCRTAIAFIVLP